MTRPRLSQDALDYFREQGAKGGKIGGPAAAANMTAAQRKARATKASLSSRISLGAALAVTISWSRYHSPRGD